MLVDSFVRLRHSIYIYICTDFLGLEKFLRKGWRVISVEIDL